MHCNALARCGREQPFIGGLQRSFAKVCTHLGIIWLAANCRLLPELGGWIPGAGPIAGCFSVLWFDVSHLNLGGGVSQFEFIITCLSNQNNFQFVLQVLFSANSMPWRCSRWIRPCQKFWAQSKCLEAAWINQPTFYKGADDHIRDEISDIQVGCWNLKHFPAHADSQRIQDWPWSRWSQAGWQVHSKGCPSRDVGSCSGGMVMWRSMGRISEIGRSSSQEGPRPCRPIGKAKGQIKSKSQAEGKGSC